MGSPREIATYLQLDQSSPTWVSGRYTQSGTALRFSVTADRMELRDDANLLLFAYSARSDGTEELALLDSASIVGWQDGAGNDVELDSGDVDGAIAMLMARPEVQIATYLSPALADAGNSALANAVTLPLHTLLGLVAEATGVDPSVPANADLGSPADGGSCDMGGDMSPADLSTHPSDLSAPAADLATGGGDLGAPRFDMKSPSPADLALAMPRLRSTQLPASPPTAATDCQDISNHYCDNCLGMCGRKCHCWPWVCGDCCWHRGCYLHDLHCRACDRHHPRECLLCALFDFGRPLRDCSTTL